ncbi:alpha/beta fold hydrolase [Paenibacillus sp. FSL K6-0108]|uniref:alpha/beta fold hydrolase n=1 Tax=Paenibacillus sp. FSL K6-0108 TaxID=2921417 RepID=UPI00324BD353
MIVKLMRKGENMKIEHKTISVDGISIFYREAGNKDNPTILLLHGYPSSSHMYRNLIPKLAGQYHVIAPDYPGFGRSDQPTVEEFAYTFDNLSEVMYSFIEKLEMDKFSIYVHDFGAPVGFILASKHPERIQTVISQNGNAYEEGLEPAWAPVRAFWENPKDENNIKAVMDLFSEEIVRLQYVSGTRNPEHISPDNWVSDMYRMNQPGNREIMLALHYDYQNNLKAYPIWHDYFRRYQPPTLVAWGKNDMFFGPNGALAYNKDLKDVEIHLLNTGHFPLEEDLEISSTLILQFLNDRLNK